jgi:hypothetical protein
MSYYPPYQNYYGIGLFDDIHNFFPDMIYNPGRFATVQDLLFYMREQIRYRTDRDSYALNHCAPPVPVQPPPPPSPPPTYRPTYLGRSQPRAEESPEDSLPGAAQPLVGGEHEENLRFLDSLLNIFTQPAGTISFFNTTLGDRYLRPINLNNLTPVLVVPTAQQLASGTEVYNAGPDDRTSQCMICLEGFIEGTQIRRITHCQHKFHKNCIDIWFTRNVHCPNCRHDIRDIDDESDDESDGGLQQLD